MEKNSCHKKRKIRRLNSRGFSSVVGAIFLFLIVSTVASVYFVFTLQQNTLYNSAVRANTQSELDRLNERIVASEAEYSVLDTNVTIEMSVLNTGKVPVELKSLWVLDNSTGSFGFVNTSILVPIGENRVLSNENGNAVKVACNGPINVNFVTSWFVTARGNTVTVERLVGTTNYESIYGPVAPVYSSFSYMYCNNTIDPDKKTPEFYQNLNQSGYLVGSPLDNGTGYPAYNIPGTCKPIFSIKVRNTDMLRRNITINSYSAMNFKTVDRYICTIINGMITPYNDLNPVVIHPDESVRLFFGAKLPAAAGEGFVIGDKISVNDKAATQMVYIMICGYYDDGMPFSMDYPFASTYTWKDDKNGFDKTNGLVPNWGKTGTTVSLKVGWYEGGPIVDYPTIYWYDPYKGTQMKLGTLSTKTTGSFIVPSASAGYYAIGVSDGISNMWATFYHTGEATINLSPTSGPVDQSITVIGSNYQPFSTITLRFNNDVMTTIPSPVIINANGAFSCSFNAPEIAPGTYNVTATGSAGNSSSKTFTVLPTPRIDPNSASSTAKDFGDATLDPALAITTSNTNDVIYAVLFTKKTGITFSAPTATGLTFVSRGSINAGGDKGQIQSWYAIASSAGSRTITFHTSGNTGGSVAMVFAVSGANIAAPFDNNLGTAQTNKGTSSSGSVQVTTTNNKDLLVGMIGLTSDKTINQGSGFTRIDFDHGGGVAGSDECKTLSSSGTYSVGFSHDSANWVIIADAFAAPSITLNPVSGPVGTTITISGTGFAPNKALTAEFNGQSVTLGGTTTTNANGAFSGATIVVPASSAGYKTVKITDSATPPNSGYAAFTVT